MYEWWDTEERDPLDWEGEGFWGFGGGWGGWLLLAFPLREGEERGWVAVHEVHIHRVDWRERRAAKAEEPRPEHSCKVIVYYRELFSNHLESVKYCLELSVRERISEEESLTWWNGLPQLA